LASALVKNDVGWIYEALVEKDELAVGTHCRPTIPAERVVALLYPGHQVIRIRSNSTIHEHAAQGGAADEHSAETIFFLYCILIGLAGALSKVKALSIQRTSVRASKVQAKVILRDAFDARGCGAVKEPVLVCATIGLAKSSLNDGTTVELCQHWWVQRSNSGIVYIVKNYTSIAGFRASPGILHPSRKILHTDNLGHFQPNWNLSVAAIFGPLANVGVVHNRCIAMTQP
jgi:hypothetical protein